MADFTQTISNSLNLFGKSPTNNWGSLTWGTDVWAFDGRVVETEFDQIDALSDTLTLSDTWSTVVDFNLSLSNTVTISPEMITGLVLSDSQGYSQVFVGPVTNADGRSEPTYTQSSPGSVTYTQVTPSSVTWTEQ